VISKDNVTNGVRNDSSEIALDVDLQFAGLGSENDLLHVGTQDLASLQPGCLGISTLRRR
jgi:hypothetical protein